MTAIDEAVEEHPHRRVDDGDVVRVRWSMVFQVVGYVLGLFTLYNILTNRMTANEIYTQQLRSDVSEMKADVKILLARKP